MRAFEDLRGLLHLPRFRRLFTVRVVSQLGDGMFQVGLAALFFFSPERMATANDVAWAFTVLLIPFTVVGPFAGPLLDRWRRRQVLVFGNAIRFVLTVILAVVVSLTGPGPLVYVLALVTLGVNRFLLAALSAGQPRVVPPEQLVIANSLAPTFGAVAAVGGAAIGIGIQRVTPTEWQDGVVLAIAAVVFALSSGLGTRLQADELGPDKTNSSFLGAIQTTATDLNLAARHLIARRTPAAVIIAMGTQRFVYGVNFLVLILVSRNLYNPPSDAAAGLATFASLTAFSFLGNGLAVLITPVATTWIEPMRWAAIGLAMTALAEIVLAVSSQIQWVYIGVFLGGMGIQGTKIAADTVVQRDTADAYRGRAFVFYDMIYNSTFVAAAAVAAAALPDQGWSRFMFIGLALLLTILGGLSLRIPTQALDVDGQSGDATTHRLWGVRGERPKTEP